MARKLNYGNQVQPDITPGELSAQVSDYAELQRLKPVQTDEETAERIDYFFRWCADRQIRPTVSLLGLCLGYSRQTMWNWQQKGGTRGALIDRAKQVLESLTESWLLAGRTNPVSGIFVLKSQFGYKDSISVEVSQANPLEAQLTPEEIAERIAADIPAD